MSKIELNRQQLEQLSEQLQRYCDSEFDFQLGQFEAEFLLQFVIDKIGPEIYNQALTDAQIVVDSRMEELKDGLYQIEKTSQL